MSRSHRIVVVGAGLVGGHLARLLAAAGFEVRAADVNAQSLAKLEGTPGLTPVKANAMQPGELAKLAADADLIVGAVPGAIGLRLLELAIAVGKPVVDISFSPEDPVLQLDAAAKKRGVPVVVDCGLAPGISNLCCGRLAAELGKVDTLDVLVGGLPVVRRYPFEYATVFSPIDVIAEYLRPARMIENGAVSVREALTDIELHDFHGLGTLESFNTDGLRTLLHTVPARRMREKTLRFPGHAALMHAFRSAGFFADEPVQVPVAGKPGERVGVRPVDLTLELFMRAWQRRPGEEEFSVLRVEAVGTSRAGTTERWRYDLLDRTAAGVSSMARTTATPAAIVATGLLRGDLPMPAAGVHPPETLGRDRATFDYVRAELNRHDIRVTHDVAVV